jgi:hypothetical protein
MGDEVIAQAAESEQEEEKNAYPACENVALEASVGKRRACL